MIKCFLILVFVNLFFSCSITKKGTLKDKFYPKSLYRLYSYKTGTDTIGSKYVTYYQKFGLSLRLERNGNKYEFIYNNKVVFSGSWEKEKFDYQFEIFDNSYLLVSLRPVTKLGESDLTKFSRDSMIIADLNKSIVNKVNLKQRYLTVNSEAIKTFYHEELKKYTRAYKYCSIDSIDLPNHKIYLFTDDLKTETFETSELK